MDTFTSLHRETRSVFGWRFVVLLCCSVVGGVGLLLAQSTAGNIVGTITDVSGGVVPGVLVKATQQRTNFSRETHSNSVGIYEFPILLPGTYTITAEKQGFRKYIDADLTLTSRQVLRVNIVLAVGAVAQTVAMVGAAPITTTDTGTISETYSEKMILQGSRGTLIGNELFGQDEQKTSMLTFPGMGGGFPKGMGDRATEWQTTLDGNPIDFSLETQVPYSGISEIKVVAVGAPAEYVAPMTVDAVSKGGTNAFHGAVTFQHMNGALNALPATFVGTRAEGSPGIPTHVWNLTGGGPLYIPKVYDGRNRTFIFISAERSNPTQETIADGQAPAYSVPTVDMRNGIFQPEFNAEGEPTKVLTNSYTGLPFPNNQIPASMISPVAIKAMNIYYPTPNLTTANPNLPFENAQGPHYTHSHSNWELARLDQKIGQKGTLTVSFNQRPTFTAFSNASYDGVIGTGGLGNNENIYSARNVGVAFTRILSPTVVNEGRFFYYDYGIFHGFTTTVGSVTSKLGINLGSDAATRDSLLQAPDIQITGYQAIGNVYPYSATVASWTEARDDLTFQHGRHSFKFGYDQMFKRDDSPSSSDATGGYRSFDGSFSGDAWADFELGLPQQTQRYTPSIPIFNEGFNELGIYAQDDWDATPSLS